MIGVGDVLAVQTSNSFVRKMILIGAVLRGRPAIDNHVVVVHHKDSSGQWWGLEGKPGGVGQTTLDQYLSSPFTINNSLQPKTDQQRYDIAVAAESMLGTPYDWAGIARDGLEAIDASATFASSWHGQGPPGHVVCSSFAAWLYGHVNLDAPLGGSNVTPADWTAFSITNKFNAAL